MEKICKKVLFSYLIKIYSIFSVENISTFLSIRHLDLFLFFCRRSDCKQSWFISFSLHSCFSNKHTSLKHQSVVTLICDWTLFVDDNNDVTECDARAICRDAFQWITDRQRSSKTTLTCKEERWKENLTHPSSSKVANESFALLIQVRGFRRLAVGLLLLLLLLLLPLN